MPPISPKKKPKAPIAPAPTVNDINSAPIEVRKNEQQIMKAKFLSFIGKEVKKNLKNIFTIISNLKMKYNGNLAVKLLIF